jgi:MOSC domain-containing protein YiiM
MSGKVVSIYISRQAGEAMQALDSVRALPGEGLEGDRYHQKQGTYSEAPGGGRQVTLIEVEALDAMEAERGIRLEAGETRRNIVTRGVQLNALVGAEFKVGQVRLRGVRLCEPCSYLEGMTQPGVLEGLVHRGGLRADILTEGVIQVGDAILISR